MLHTAVGPGGNEAVAVTADHVSVKYRLGDADATLDRHAAWTLSREGGTWKVTNMILQTKDFQ